MDRPSEAFPKRRPHQIHVSPVGNGPGAIDDPCALDRVMDLVRAARARDHVAIEVVLHGGEYHLEEPTRIDAKAAGRSDWELTVRPAAGASPVLTGAKTVSGWTLHDPERGIWSAPLPPGSRFEHLWDGNQRLLRARSGWNCPGFANSRRGLKLTGKSPDVERWKNLKDVVVTKQMMWRNIPAAVHSVAGGEVRLDPATVARSSVPKTALGVMEPISLYGLLNGWEMLRAQFYLENAYELLTDEGEWYLDRESSVLFFKPFAESGFGQASTLTFASLRTFFLLDGSVDAPIWNVAIRGLCLRYSGGTRMGVTAGFPTEPTKFTSPRPEAAIQVNAGRGITIAENQFVHVGHDALHFDLGGSDLCVTGNGFGDVSRSAISLNQTNLLVSEQSKRGVLAANVNKFFDGVTIENNYIRRTGIDSPAPAVSYSEFTRNLRFAHNHVRESATQAIRGSWRHLGWRGHTGNIEYAWNRTEDVSQAGLRDFGALYVSCSNAGYTRIHHNFVDGVGLDPSNAGIYLDVFVDGAEVDHNVSVNMPTRALTPVARGWVVLVMSTNSNVHDNWSDRLTYKDFDQGRYRFFWPDPTNRLRDNHEIDDLSDLPPEGLAVVERAGLESGHRALRMTVDAQLTAGFDYLSPTR